MFQCSQDKGTGDEFQTATAMRVYENRHFANLVVAIDHARFIRCAFDSCTIKYSGAAYEIIDCSFSSDTRWEFRDAAMRTAALMENVGMVNRNMGTRSKAREQRVH
jgi:hypothetical protein